MMEGLHAVSGMDVLLLDSLGMVRIATPRQARMPFVQLLRSWPQTAARLERNRQARLSGGQGDRVGLQEIVKPIEAEGETAGYLLLSGFRNESDDIHWARDLWCGLARAGVPVRWAEWQEAWRVLPALGPRQEQAWRQVMALYVEDVLRRIEKGKPVVAGGQQMSALVQATCLRIRDHYQSPLRLQEIARELGVCAEHVSRSFHAATGMRFCEYLAEMRTEAACEALENTDRTIAQIAFECGFSNLSRFNRCFRAHRDMTPSAWRKRARIRGRDPERLSVGL